PQTSLIEVDGKRVTTGVARMCLLLNKPRGCVTTRRDPQGRPTVMDWLPPEYQHLHPVGRLDFDTEGLLLLTNDGALTNALTHPRHAVPKTYRAWVRGRIRRDALRRLERGVVLDDGPTAPARVRMISQNEHVSVIEIEIHEGRKRQVRRMCAAVGHPVLALRRVRLGDVTLGNLKPGEYRRLTEEEIERLRKWGNGG
ncbi:MAG: rRNA pseudouridine synthase, partial [Abditibacteriales bacterium]|nr:rRNA pseudouridine synthase [Abditibacteriales bacterium]MDW8368118.1 pseudouridine synthase [Abditibacteriales bacterium]